MLEFRVVLAGSRSWSWCGSRSWTGAACYRAVLSGGAELVASVQILCNPGAVFSIGEREFRVVRAGTAVASDWAALADGLQCATFRTLLGDPVAVLFLVVVVLEIRVVLAGTRTAVACDWAALADGLQCATFLTLLGDPVAVLPPLVVVLEFRVVLAAKHSSGRKAQHQYCHERPVVTHGTLILTRRPVKIEFSP